MPVGNRVALFGFGHLRHVYKSLISSPVKNKTFDIDFKELTKAIFEDKGVSLTDIYKKVQHKYYPEKDYFGIKK